MSNKLPVGEVLNEAFQFALRRWATVLRFAWLPLLAAVAVLLGYFFLIFDVAKFDADNNSAALLSFKEYMRAPPFIAGVLGAGAYALILLFYAGMMTSVFRLVALGEERPGIFQLRADGPTIRVFWSLLIVGLIGTAIWTVAFFASLAMTGQAAGEIFGALKDFFWLALAAESSGEELAPSQIEALLAPLGAFGLTALLAIVPLVYVNIKLAPFPPGSAAENRLLLFGSLEMTKGRFWSIFGIMLLMLLLMMVIGTVVQIVFAILELLMSLFGNLGGAAAIGGLVVGAVYFTAMLIYQAFVYAVQLSTPAIIYRRLKTGQ